MCLDCLILTKFLKFKDCDSNLIVETLRILNFIKKKVSTQVMESSFKSSTKQKFNLIYVEIVQVLQVVYSIIIAKLLASMGDLPTA